MATYDTWTQSTGELWQQTLNIVNTQSWYQSLWLQYVQPPESDSAMFQQLDNEIATLSQSTASSSPGSTNQPAMPPPGNDAEQSLVALLCHYNDGSLARGSGVIINPQGYILTAKHMVDPQWTSWAYGKAASTATLNYCEVGIPPQNTLPTAVQIQTFGSSVTVSQPFPFIATLSFEPSQGQLSDNEYRVLDFALLKIVRPLNNCAAYNFCTLPISYPYSPVYYSAAPNTAADNNLLNFGYPTEAITTSTSQNFNLFYLKELSGRLVKYYGGDQYFKNQPLNFSWSAVDVMPGRSGSPVLWDGYVIGIEYSGEDQNITNDYAIGTPRFTKYLIIMAWGICFRPIDRKL